MKLRVDIILSQGECERLVQLAYTNGYLRKEPKKRWNDKERREAIRYYIEKIVSAAAQPLSEFS